MAKISSMLDQMIAQNRLTCSFAFLEITQENSAMRLNPSAASIGFIYRHIGETMLLFGYFFGIPISSPNTTMGKTDDGRFFELSESQELVEKGYAMLMELVQNSSEEDWSQEIDTPFFGRTSKIRLFSHILFHNAHHAGQISLTLSKGK